MYDSIANINIFPKRDVIGQKFQWEPESPILLVLLWRRTILLLSSVVCQRLSDITPIFPFSSFLPIPCFFQALILLWYIILFNPQSVLLFITLFHVDVNKVEERRNRTPCSICLWDSLPTEQPVTLVTSWGFQGSNTALFFFGGGLEGAYQPESFSDICNCFGTVTVWKTEILPSVNFLFRKACVFHLSLPWFFTL